MAVSTHLAVPPPMWQDKPLCIEWRKWKQRFQNHLTAVEDEVKLSLLLHLIGQEGIEMYNTIMISNVEHRNDGFSEFKAVMAKLESHFLPKFNITYERHKFRNRQLGETIEDCVRVVYLGQDVFL